ncbi:alkane 1-monooxygenase, partial [Mycobacterium tuberculosis]|nr:alkane 1-monooxygenase [Mycobacterium tuberculosis]
DQITVRALRRSLEASDNFPQDVFELQAYFAPAGPNQRIQAVPAAGADVPLWILGSSTFGAALAAELGLPYAFASHFAPAELMPALAIYR